MSKRLKMESQREFDFDKSGLRETKEDDNEIQNSQTT